MTKTRRDNTPQWILIPTITFILLLTTFPMAYSLYNSVMDTNLLKPYLGSTFIGLGNYFSLLQDGRFWGSVWHTVYITVSTVVIEFLLGLGLALLLNREMAGNRITRTLILIPFMTTPVVIGLIWRFLFNYDLGIINYVFRIFHLPQVLWLSNQSVALKSVVLVDVWQWTPLVALILLAGLQSLPIEPYEASLVDGCTPWQQFRRITLPLLSPSILMVLLIRTMDAIKMYDLIYVLTEGGPGTVTETISYYLYVIGFKLFYTGRAAAGSYILLIIITLISMLFIKLLRGQYQEQP
ncbi:MAG: sugar ABC transporter permease [Candidatus Atribacteria bacterium]|nr:sugar ABC transporter permease [Candidatus Atribacteria bacterium]